MNELVERIALAVEKGKINRQSPYPPAMKDQDGADELTAEALRQGVKPAEIIEGCKLGMDRIGKKFSEGVVFVPELLMAAKANGAVMVHLRPYFQSGEVKRKGRFIIGTVKGDLHDIGKNLVAMSVEGAGWEVIDLGVDIPPDRFLAAIAQNPGAAVGLSALLTTTMQAMAAVVKEIRAREPETKILVGGAPVTQAFCERIGADFYSSDPQGAVEFLNSLASS